MFHFSDFLMASFVEQNIKLVGDLMSSQMNLYELMQMAMKMQYLNQWACEFSDKWNMLHSVWMIWSVWTTSEM